MEWIPEYKESENISMSYKYFSTLFCLRSISSVEMFSEGSFKSRTIHIIILKNITKTHYNLQMKVYKKQYLLEFEFEDKDFYGSGSFFGPTEKNVNIYLNIAWVWKSFRTHTKLPIKLISVGLVGFLYPYNNLVNIHICFYGSKIPTLTDTKSVTEKYETV